LRLKQKELNLIQLNLTEPISFIRTVHLDIITVLFIHQLVH